MRRNLVVVGLAFAAVSSATAQKTQTISTFGFPAQGALDADIGTAYVGQVFTVPKNAFKLVSFSFYMDGGENPGLLQFAFDISRWLPPGDEENPNGPEDLPSQPHLYRYPQLLMGSPSPARFDFRGINLPVTPTKQYIAYLTHAGPNGDDPFVTLGVAHVGNAYADGGWLVDGAIQPVPGTEGDLMFEAEFTVTPEPTTLLLLATGLLGMGAIAVRLTRRKEQSEI